MSDLEELKRLYANRHNGYAAEAAWHKAIGDRFPTLANTASVAEGTLKPFVEMVAHGCKTGKIKSASILCGAPTDKTLEMKSLGKMAIDALAAFDK